MIQTNRGPQKTGVAREYPPLKTNNSIQTNREPPKDKQEERVPSKTNTSNSIQTEEHHKTKKNSEFPLKQLTNKSMQTKERNPKDKEQFSTHTKIKNMMQTDRERNPKDRSSQRVSPKNQTPATACRQKRGPQKDKEEQRVSSPSVEALTAVLAGQVVRRLLEDPGAGLVITVSPQATVDSLRHHPVGRGEGDDDGQVGQHQEHQPHDRTARRHHREGL